MSLCFKNEEKYFNYFLHRCILFSLLSQAKCLTAAAGLSPNYDFTVPNCNGQYNVSGNFNIFVSHNQLNSNTFDSENFKSYPNPVKDILNLSYNKTISNVSIYNLVGQKIITKSINATQSQIDMSHLASGTYLVKVTADDQMKIIKVIKQ